MNRKQFIQSHGATCLNWKWSWSFINEKDKFIIFGAWDLHTEGNTTLILSEDWKIGPKGKNLPGYEQSREHIRLIEEEGYQLRTFSMKHSKVNEEDIASAARIEEFEPKLANKSLKRVGNSWYASDDGLGNLLPEEIDTPEQYIEGASKVVSVNIYERNSDARKKCLEHYGYKCAICSFDFEEFYGAIGKKYIHVHHLIPLAEIGKEYLINPLKDLIPVCPNCHAIIHRTRPALKVEQLKQHLEMKK